MKLSYAKIISAVLTLALTISLFAVMPVGTGAVASGDYEYEYDTTTLEATITGYTGTGGDVIIPDTIDGYIVTAIGASAFYRKTSLTSVVISNNVTAIGDSAFYGCNKITAITLPVNLLSMGAYSFSGCSGLTTISIPGAVTLIGENALNECSALTEIVVDASNLAYKSVDGVLFDYTGAKLIKYPIAKADVTYTVPDGVTEIGYQAFNGCVNITGVNVTSGVSLIGDMSFAYCTSLTQINVDSGNIVYKSVDGVLFDYAGAKLIKYPIAKADVTYTISDGVTEIGYQAFNGCVNITGVNITSGVSLIGDMAFAYCTSLTQINVDSGNTIYESVDGVLYNEAKTLLIQYPTGKTGETYTVPDTVTEIGIYAFAGSINITSMTIPESVIYIDDHAFGTCVMLTKISLSNNLTTLGANAFTGCSMTFIKIPSAVTNIGDYAFSNCINLLEAKFAGNAPDTFGSNVFSGCAVKFTIYYPPGGTGWTSPLWNGYAAYEYDPGLLYEYDTTTLDATITGYTGTKGDIIIPGTIDGYKVIAIGASAFYQKTSLTSVVITDNVTAVGNSAFYGCNKMTAVTLPVNLLSIGAYAFSGCRGLTTITIPAAVISIGETAFNGCSALTEIVVDAANITYKSVDGVLFNYAGTKLIKYPIAKADETYTVPAGVTEIGYQAFNSCRNITGVTVSSDVTIIGNSAFLYCYLLETVSLPAGLTSIGDMAFAYCTSLIQIDVDSGNTVYESVDGVLYNEAQTVLIQYACGKTGTTYTIPDTVSRISKYAFAGSLSLTSMRIPESVIYIDDYAFGTCIMMTKIYLLDNLTTIGPNAFTGCAITSVKIPSTVVSIGDYAFNYCNNLAKAKFKGAVPGTFGSNVFNGCADTFTVYYPKGTAGWTSPQWNGYNTQVYDPDVLAGTDRYDTAAQISEKSCNTANTVILALGTNYPDALSGGPLAYQLGAPVLLTQKDSLPEYTSEELIRLGAEKVIVLGSEAAVSASVVTKLESMGLAVERIGGSDRYETAVKIADSVRAYSVVTDTAVIVSGENFPDALSIGSYAAMSGIPVLLTKKAVLPESTAAALIRYGITKVIIAGGTPAVSQAVLDTLDSMGITVKVLAGTDRYATGTAVAGAYFSGMAEAVIACGTNFPDALAAVPYAAKINAPILLVKPTSLPGSVSSFVSGSAITNFIIAGGDPAVGPAVRTALDELIK